MGGFTPGDHGVDSLLIGFYRGRDLQFCASVRAGFFPAFRRKALFPSATAHHRPLLLRERSRVIAGPVGSGTHSGEDEELRVGASANGGPVLLSGVDCERSPAACEQCRCARGRGRTGGREGK